MLANVLKSSLIAAAIAAGYAHAQISDGRDGYLVSGTQEPVRSAYGNCWRTGYWTEERSSQECDPQLVAQASPAAKPAAIATPLVTHSTEILFSAEVLFPFNDDRLSGEALKRLDGLAQKMVSMDIEKVTAVAHADSFGSADYNQLLSARRLWAVRDYFAAKGVTEEQFLLEAKGDREQVSPIACDALGIENGSKAKRIACLQSDRRVKVEIIGRPKRID
jgi:OOP family OmpA-OmpF porin